MGNWNQYSTAMLGKRKRSAPSTAMVAPEDSASGSQEDLQEVFRRHFEAQFKPLPDQKPQMGPSKTTETDLGPDEDVSDWDGISTDEEELSIEVVEYATPIKAEKPELSKEELKGFMVSSRHRVD